MFAELDLWRITNNKYLVTSDDGKSINSTWPELFYSIHDDKQLVMLFGHDSKDLLIFNQFVCMWANFDVIFPRCPLENSNKEKQP